MQAAIYPGRSLMFSPAWDEEGVSVVFDKGSGDYWVITEPARVILDELCHRSLSAGVPIEALEASLSMTQSEFSASVASLSEHRLIQLLDAAKST